MPQPKTSSSGTAAKRSSSTAKKPAAAKSTAAKKPTTSSRSTAAKKPATSSRSAAAKSSSTSSRSTAAKKPATAAKTPASAAAKKPTTAAKRTTAAAKPAAKRTTAASKPAAKRSAPSTRKAPTSSTPAARDEQLRQNLAQLRDALAQAVVIPAERVQAVLDDARKRGHIDAKGVQDIAGGLIEAGRKQADELRSELEAIVGRGRAGGDDLVAKVTAPARSAAKVATQAGDPVLKQVDKVVRRTGLASFPITGYDDLKVDQVKSRLGDLSKPDLRKVRTYETKHANRKAVLTAIEKALA